MGKIVKKVVKKPSLRQFKPCVLVQPGMEKESICVRNGPFFSSIGASVSLQTGFGQMRRMRSILYSVHIYVQVVKLICYACTLCQPSLRRAQWVIPVCRAVGYMIYLMYCK